MRAPYFSLALNALLCLGALGCGTDSEVCAPVEVPMGDSRSATADDVAPILDRSCALGGCHLSLPGAGGLVLGRSTGAWRAALVDVPSVQNPTMPLVAPGDPDRSWLVAKILGSSCDAACDPRLGCGGPMPPGEPLTAAERATIIAWIADGAR